MDLKNDINYISSLTKKPDLLKYLRTIPSDIFFPVNKKGSAASIKSQILENLNSRYNAQIAILEDLKDYEETLARHQRNYQEEEPEEVTEQEELRDFAPQYLSDYLSERKEVDDESIRNGLDEIIDITNTLTLQDKDAMPKFWMRGQLYVTPGLGYMNPFFHNILFLGTFIDNLYKIYKFIDDWISNTAYPGKIDITKPIYQELYHQGDIDLLSERIKDSTSVIKGVDVGYKSPTVSYGNEPGLCGPNMFAAILKGHKVSFDGKVSRWTKDITAEDIVREIDKYRGNKSDSSEGYTIKEMAHVAKKLDMNYFYVISSTGKLIHKWNNEGRTNIPGCICLCNSLHFTHIAIKTSVGVSPASIVPGRILEKNWINSPAKYALEETEEKTAFYLSKPINDMAIDHIRKSGIVPNIIRIKNQSITCFSIGEMLFKYAEDMDLTIPWCKSLDILFRGQSLATIAYKVWESKVSFCYTSPRFYQELKHNAPYCHSGIFTQFRNKDLKHYKAVDCTKCFTYCLENMPCGKFQYSNEVEPFKAPINPLGFYYTSKMQGLKPNSYWPHHGPGYWYPGFEILGYMEDGMKITIQSQVLPYAQYKNISTTIVDIFNNGGKKAANDLAGMLSHTSDYLHEKIFITDSINELAYYLLNGGCDVAPFEIGGKEAYKLKTYDTPEPEYKNYLPIAKTLYGYARLLLYKKVKELKGLGALVAVFTDCLVFDTRLVTLNLPMKSTIPKDARGVFAIEDHIPEKRQLLKQNERVFKPMDYQEYDKYDKMPLDHHIFCNGAAGVGKSTVLIDFIKDLRAAGKNPLITSATHITAAKLDPEAMTTHSALGLSFTKKLGIPKVTSKHTHFIVDEFYFLDKYVQHALVKLRQTHPQLRLILFGCNKQLTIGGGMLPNSSSLMAFLCFRAELVLTRNYRFETSPKLAKLCNEFIDYFDGKADYPNLNNHDIGAADHDLAITATNDMRDVINEFWKLRYRPENPTTRNTLPFIIFVGMPLVKREKEGEIINGQFCIIREIKDDVIFVEHTDINRQPLTPRKFDMLADQELKGFNMAWAITGHYSQGSTIKIPYTVYESEKVRAWAERNKDWQYWEYVVYSRGIKIELLNIKDSFNPCSYSEPMDPELFLL